LRALLLLVLCLLTAPLGAQQTGPQGDVRGLVSQEGAGGPIEGAMVLLLDEHDRVAARVLTSRDGRFRVAAPTWGRYRLRVDRIGFASTTTDLFVVQGAVERNVATPVRPIRLDGLDVGGDKRCEVRPDEGMATAVVWEEARKALAASTLTAERGLYRFTWMRYDRRLDRDGSRVLSDRRTSNRHFTSQPFVPVDPARLVAEGFAQTPNGGQWVYAAPDATVLLSDGFLDTHCFHLELGTRERGGQIGLAFEPLGGRRMVEVTGVLWMDPTSGRLRELEYRYVNLPGELRDARVGGELFFAGMPNGTWIVKEWRIRMPRGSIEQDSFGRRRAVVIGYEEEGGVVSQAATSVGEIAYDAAGGAVRGLVRDSVGGPARGVWVSVAGTAFSALTDAGGAFNFPELGRGLWTVTATSPELDLVGRTVSTEVDVQAGEVRELRVELPSVREAALERCWSDPPGPDEAVLVGRVVDERGAPVLRALVSVRWSDFSFLLPDAARNPTPARRTWASCWRT
jgi:hypothetical protein